MQSPTKVYIQFIHHIRLIIILFNQVLKIFYFNSIDKNAADWNDYQHDRELDQEQPLMQSRVEVYYFTFGFDSIFGNCLHMW